MSGRVNPKKKKDPSRTSRYYRCSKFRAEYELISVTGGCPNRRCQKEACPNYMGTLPRGRPALLLTDEELQRRRDATRSAARDRMQEFREICRIESDKELPIHVALDRASVLALGYQPSPSSKYYRCKRFQRAPFRCPIPRRHCLGCEHYDSNDRRGGGVKNRGLYDWNDSVERRLYNRAYARRKKE